MEAKLKHDWPRDTLVVKAGASSGKKHCTATTASTQNRYDADSTHIPRDSAEHKQSSAKEPTLKSIRLVQKAVLASHAQKKSLQQESYDPKSTEAPRASADQKQSLAKEFLQKSFQPRINMSKKAVILSPGQKQATPLVTPVRCMYRLLPKARTTPSGQKKTELELKDLSAAEMKHLVRAGIQIVSPSTAGFAGEKPTSPSKRQLVESITGTPSGQPAGHTDKSSIHKVVMKRAAVSSVATTKKPRTDQDSSNILEDVDSTNKFEEKANSNKISTNEEELKQSLSAKKVSTSTEPFKVVIAYQRDSFLPNKSYKPLQAAAKDKISSLSGGAVSVSSPMAAPATGVSFKHTAQTEIVVNMNANMSAAIKKDRDISPSEKPEKQNDLVCMEKCVKKKDNVNEEKVSVTNENVPVNNNSVPGRNESRPVCSGRSYANIPCIWKTTVRSAVATHPSNAYVNSSDNDDQVLPDVSDTPDVFDTDLISDIDEDNTMKTMLDEKTGKFKRDPQPVEKNKFRSDPLPAEEKMPFVRTMVTRRSSRLSLPSSLSHHDYTQKEKTLYSKKKKVPTATLR